MTDISGTARLLVRAYPRRVPRVLFVAILDRDSMAARQARAGDGWRPSDSRRSAARLLATHLSMQVVRGRRHETSGRRPSLKGAPAKRLHGMLGPKRARTGICCRFPWNARVMNSAASGRQRALGRPNRQQGACNIHHLKEFGTCVSAASAKSTAG